MRDGPAFASLLLAEAGSGFTPRAGSGTRWPCCSTRAYLIEEYAARERVAVIADITRAR